MKKKIAAGLILLLSMAFLAGCGQNNEPPKEEEPPEEVYPISINGVEVRVGETTVQTLLDAGYKVTVSEMDSNNQITEYEIDPEELEFYMGGEPEEWGIVSLNGVPVNEIDQDKGHEMFPDFSIYDYYMVKYGKDYNYSFNFSQQNDLLNHFTVEREYDVDWNGDGQ